ncbi:MAG: CatB-related O-acetyltransferase [Gammaproteobacteria bacterium]
MSEDWKNIELSGIRLILYKLYGIKRNIVKKLILRILYSIDGPNYTLYSQTLRKIFADYHDVNIGMYSMGGCFVPGAFPIKTTIGRYSSIAMGVLGFGANHPMNLKSSHGLFFNPTLGLAKERLVDDSPLEIGNDVWIGQNAIILPSVKKIGDGAVIGAGVVVNKDIPPYAVVTGHPGRVVKVKRYVN